MFPNIDLFGKTITPYFICALIGIFVVLFVSYKMAQKRGLDEMEMLPMMLCSFGGVVIFSHILYAFTVPETVGKVLANLDKIKDFDTFMYAMGMIFGGSVFYGGLIGAVFAFFLYCKIRKLPFGDYSDIGGMMIPLFHFFGRLGCFTSGCCYGVEWEYGIVYEYSVVESANHVHRFPVQLVEALLNLALFFFLLYLYKKGKAAHKLLNLYLLIYPVYRFILEYFRGDTYRGAVGFLSTSQFISVIIFAFAIVWLIAGKVREKKAH